MLYGFSDKYKNWLFSYILVLSILFPFKPGTIVSVIHLIIFFGLFFFNSFENIKETFKDMYTIISIVFVSVALFNFLLFNQIDGYTPHVGIKDTTLFPVYFVVLFLCTKHIKIDINSLMKLFVIGIFINSIIFFISSYYIHFGEDSFYQLILNNYLTAISPKFMFSKIYAVYLALGSFFGLLQVFRERFLKVRLIFITITLLLIIFIFMTNCRGVILSFFFLLLFIGIAFLIKHKSRFGVKPNRVLKTLITISFIVGIFFMSSLGENFINKLKIGFNQITEAYLQDNFEGSWGIRLHIWKLLLDQIDNYFWIGTGLGNLKYYYFSWLESQGISPGIRAHNVYLEYWIAMGILGLVAFLTLLFYPIFKMIKHKKTSYIYMFFILFFVLINFEDTYLSYNSSFFLYAFFNYLFYTRINQLIALEKEILR